MTQRSSTVIAAIMLGQAPSVGIDVLADQMLTSKLAERAGARSVTWDCEDLVFLDFDGLRIALHRIEEQDAHFICIGVGPVPGRQLAKSMDVAAFAHMLVRRYTDEFPANAVLWNESSAALSAEVMDDFHDELERMIEYLALQMAEANPPKETENPNGTCAIKGEIHPKQAHQDRYSKRAAVLNDEDSLAALRLYLRGQNIEFQEISSPLHASLYVMACTFLFMVPAVGTALFSYVALRDGMDRNL